ncbi:MAG TPA: phosphotransferase [Candidatus Bathyarchaeia archaeon]|nr:phosphotransferase [Candidatus Bathyarchaeia archaeon]
MLGQRNYLKNLNFIKKLAKKKNWQIDFKLVGQKLRKDRPHFLDFPLVDDSGKTLFFKTCIFGRQDLCPGLRNEFAIQEWLESIGGPVGKIYDYAGKGDLFWYVREYFPQDEGVICQEEDVSPLNVSNITQLAGWLKFLWQIKKSQIPADLFNRLLLTPKNYRTFKQFEEKVIEYLSMLDQAFKIKNLIWQEKDRDKVLVFIRQVKSEIVAVENGEGIVVHGDLSPNNIYFGKKVIIFDWEWICYCDNLLLGLGIDVANFYTRSWQRLKLGKKFLEEVKKQNLFNKSIFNQALRIGMVFSVLQKLGPIFRHGFYESEYDQRHFNVLVKIMREYISEVSGFYTLEAAGVLVVRQRSEKQDFS